MLRDINGAQFDAFPLHSDRTLARRHCGRQYHAHEHRLPGRGRPLCRQALDSRRKLSAADLQLILPPLLDQMPRHGYETIKSLGEHSNDFYVPSPGTLLPARTYPNEIGLRGFQAIANKIRCHVIYSGRKRFEENRAAVTQLLSDLKRTGSQAGPARLAVEAGSGIANEDEAIRDQPEATGREVRRAQRELGPVAINKSRCIGKIIDQAADKIRLGSAAPPPHAPDPSHNNDRAHPARAAASPSRPAGKARDDVPAGNDKSSL